MVTIKQACLDYFIVSNIFIDLLSDAKLSQDINLIILEINMEISNFERGKGLWKLKCNLLKKFS